MCLYLMTNAQRYKLNLCVFGSYDNPVKSSDGDLFYV